MAATALSRIAVERLSSAARVRAARVLRCNSRACSSRACSSRPCSVKCAPVSRARPREAPSLSRRSHGFEISPVHLTICARRSLPFTMCAPQIHSSSPSRSCSEDQRCATSRPHLRHRNSLLARARPARGPDFRARVRRAVCVSSTDAATEPLQERPAVRLFRAEDVWAGSNSHAGRWRRSCQYRQD